MRLRRFPLASRFVIDVHAGRPARVVHALAGAADWRRSALDRIGAAMVGVLGTRLLPAATGWTWPALDADELRAELRGMIDDDRLELDAAVMPRQTGRRRLSLLCHRGDEPIVVKLGVPTDGLDTETLALELLTSDPLPGIATPRVIAAGTLVPDRSVEPVVVLATSALGLRRQRPAVDEPLRTFETDLAARLTGIPRPAGTPSGFVPVHGDLAPWNLRRTGRGLALFDWESAGWGAPGSDLEYYRRTSMTLRS